MFGLFAAYIPALMPSSSTLAQLIVCHTDLYNPRDDIFGNVCMSSFPPRRKVEGKGAGEEVVRDAKGEHGIQSG